MTALAKGYTGVLKPLDNMVSITRPWFITDRTRQFLDSTQMFSLFVIQFIIHLLCKLLFIKVIFGGCLSKAQPYRK